MDAKTLISDLLSEAEVIVNGPNPWDIQVHDDQFFQRVVEAASLGFGESYMESWWDCEALDECTRKISGAQLEQKLKENWKMLGYVARSRMFNRQNRARAPLVAEQHYDLGNDLYRAMLDARLCYTCGYWKDVDTLDKAQEAKLDLVCRKINLSSGMTVLELGCGWGSFAKYAAEKYGARVVGVNICKEQVRLARELCAGLPIEIRQQDYREVEGNYDAVISIGILEHVGYKNYRTYMKTVNRCLKDDGIAFVHTIGRNTSTSYTNPWFDKYIFPNGMLPSIAQIGDAMEGLLVMEDWHNFGPDYDTTLIAWYHNFERAWPQLKAKYGDRFYRMWRFYLLSSAGSFRARTQQLWQIVMTKPGRRHPDCRFS
ncbi:MAG: cyclopropane fatty acyl phospholipid synthase [bacterium]|nr:cyclopropane fatty acyl phospholipid synthase [bacterium]